jgi:hypothetical protein
MPPFEPTQNVAPFPKEPIAPLETACQEILQSEKPFGKKKADLIDLMLKRGVSVEDMKTILTRYGFYGEIGQVETSTIEKGEAQNDITAAPADVSPRLPYLDRDDDELVPDPNHPGEMIMKKFLN